LHFEARISSFTSIQAKINRDDSHNRQSIIGTYIKYRKKYKREIIFFVDIVLSDIIFYTFIVRLMIAYLKN